MDNNLLNIGTRLQLTGILNDSYGHIKGYSGSVDSPYIVKTDEGLEVTCGHDDIQATIYTPADLGIKDTSFTISPQVPKFEKGQIVFYELDHYTRQVVVIDEVDADNGDYYISYLDDTSGYMWVDEQDLTEITGTSDCLDNAIAKYQDLSKSLTELYASIDMLDKELRKQRSHMSVVRFFVEASEQDVLNHARALGAIEEE